MNALLQRLGQLLAQPGQSIAAQNFNECLTSLVLLAVYGLLLYRNIALMHVLAGFGVFMLIAMAFIIVWHRSSRSDSQRKDGIRGARAEISADLVPDRLR